MEIKMEKAEKWLGRQDSNLRMLESKSRVLPLDDAPVVSARLLTTGPNTTVSLQIPSSGKKEKH